MRTLFVFLPFIGLLGCSSVQNQTFNLDISQDFTLEASDSLEFSLLCEQLSVIAYMNFLDSTPAPEMTQGDSDKSCTFTHSESDAGYSFAFAYNTSEDQGYDNSTKRYPSKTSYMTKTIELSAYSKPNSVNILLQANNQDRTFEKLSYLVDKLLIQEYSRYYTTTQLQKKTSQSSYY
jgi:hypothetical protein